MKDEKIIKALECCNKPANEGGCLDCPLKEERHKGCSGVMIENVIDLINRQKARIKELEEAKEDLNGTVKNLLEQFAEFKTEAIKEFAERVKEEKYYGGNPIGYGTWVVEVESIDDLVKEMEKKYEIS